VHKRMLPPGFYRVELYVAGSDEFRMRDATHDALISRP
jgi:hypothetical protein